jgi:hypothetical protein
MFQLNKQIVPINKTYLSGYFLEADADNKLAGTA